MGARSYVPQIGRFLQPDPVPGGSANAYSYTFGDPVNTTDPTGDYTNNGSIALEQALSNEAQAAAAARQAAAEAAARAAAEKAAREAAEAAAAAAGPQYAGGEEWGEGAEEWEEWEEEGSYEYASYQHGGENGEEEHHIEPAILVQPLSSDEQNAGQLFEVKGGPGICQGHCSRAHHIWSHARPEHWEGDCAKGTAGYILLATPVEAINPVGDIAGCTVGILLGKI